PFFAQRHAGAPLKPVVAHWLGLDGEPRALQGECVASGYGIEGSLVYALSADLRDTINRDGHAMLWLDLVPGRDEARLLADLSQPRKGRSFGEHLRRHAGLDAVKTALVFEMLGKDAGQDLQAVVTTLKRLPLRLLRPRPMAEVISTAGGVRLQALDQGLMLHALPGVFCAGEMLDWEAPTGGYLLTACYASGLRAAEGAIAWLAGR
ncbi:MAG: TIGR03862 family flavoprotein, partial [Stenotrophomonas sp.]